MKRQKKRRAPMPELARRVRKQLHEQLDALLWAEVKAPDGTFTLPKLHDLCVRLQMGFTVGVTVWEEPPQEQAPAVPEPVAEPEAPVPLVHAGACLDPACEGECRERGLEIVR